MSISEQLRRRRVVNFVWRKYPDLFSGLTGKQLRALEEFYDFRRSPNLMATPDTSTLPPAMRLALDGEASLPNRAGRAYRHLMSELVERKDEIRAAGLWEIEDHPLVTRTEWNRSRAALRKVARALIEVAKENELRDSLHSDVVNDGRPRLGDGRI